ncbi:MAG: signal peptide peptidase SppA, type, protease [Candidatus Kaiserbacteria bacterium]|nr:signal peptide peptidase SppA, type, protease [Candidatus Kaiserbacteria bacterium]
MMYLWRHIAVIVAATICAVIGFMVCMSWYGHWYNHFSGADRGVSDGVCNIAVVPIQGIVTPYDDPNAPQYGGTNEPSASGDGFVRAVHNAERDPNILGIIVPIDSGGGSVVPSVMMMNALKRSPLPSVALIREMGASAAYMAATGASTIIASPYSDVGSIGVTYSYLSNVQKDKQDGIAFVQLSSGPYKDTGSPDKPLSDAELALYDRDIKIYKDLFVNTVAENRHMATSSVDALADGSTFPGEMAFQNGLIDQLGDEETAKAWLAEKLGMTADEVILCN